MEPDHKKELLRSIPRVDDLLVQVRKKTVSAPMVSSVLLESVRRVLEDLRGRILSEALLEIPSIDALVQAVFLHAANESAWSLVPVINCTGVALHTNLGRSPLPSSVMAHLNEIALNYSNLEYEISRAGRGSRHVHVEQQLIQLTGCEAAMVVNNNAAAVLLALSALCQGKEVIVSRGELVEIGGSFRIPEVIEQGGAKLKEVGATNRTRLSDYEKAFDPVCTGGLLKVHTSNFRMVGFTEQVSAEELSALGSTLGIPLIYDLGSGTFLDLGPLGILDEPTVPKAIAQGADLVCFSGDKLLGAGQAGIILGKKKYIDQLKRHPLARALRVDKMTLAALEGVLRLYGDPESAKKEIPILSMIFVTPEELRERAEKLLAGLGGIAGFQWEVVAANSPVGGGAAPEFLLPSYAVSVFPLRMGLNELEEKLRAADPPVIGRIYKERLLLDVRTILEGQEEWIQKAFEQIGNGIQS